MTLISTSLQENLNLKRMNNVNEEDIQQFLNFYIQNWYNSIQNQMDIMVCWEYPYICW